MAENSIEQKESKDFVYQEFEVNSFEEAAARVLEAEEIEDIPRFLIVDVDGTLFDDIVQYPIISTLMKPVVKEEIKDSFIALAHCFQDRMAIATNRDSREDLVWGSYELMDVVVKLIALTGVDIRIFERMEKQIPRLAKKRIEILVDYMTKTIQKNYGEDCKSIMVNSIEDKSFVSFNREGFLKYIRNRLSEKWNINMRVNNYVIK
jgi:hypothetical protein